jgi:hypothetical protein
MEDIQEVPETGDIKSILETLIPEDGASIKSIDGKEFKLPSVVSARRQIKALRHLEKAMDILTGIEIDEDVMGDLQKMIMTALDIAQDERILDILDECFEAAYPNVIAECGNPATEAFELNEVLQGLVPFIARLALQALGGMEAVGKTLSA